MSTVGGGGGGGDTSLLQSFNTAAPHNHYHRQQTQTECQIRPKEILSTPNVMQFLLRPAGKTCLVDLSEGSGGGPVLRLVSNNVRLNSSSLYLQREEPQRESILKRATHTHTHKITHTKPNARQIPTASTRFLHFIKNISCPLDRSD